MLRQAKQGMIPIQHAVRRGYSDEEGLRAAIADGRLPATRGANDKELFSVQDLEKVFGPAKKVYGLEWGDPDDAPRLRKVRDEYLVPFFSPQSVVVEIGPGGGRWTRYMQGAAKLYAVDYHQELLDELKVNFGDVESLVCIKNNGNDFPDIPDNSVDFIFSFGTFVHLELDIISGYLGAMTRIMKPDAIAVIHYSDKTKKKARENRGFSNNTPAKMRRMIETAGFETVFEDVKLLDHSAIVGFRIKS